MNRGFLRNVIYTVLWFPVFLFATVFEIFNFFDPKNDNIFGGQFCLSLYIKLTSKVHHKLNYSQWML